MSEWIETSKRLPPERKYVLGRHNRGTWFDGDDQKNVNYVVVKLVKGLSEEERASLPDGDKKRTYKFGDVFGSNLVPYEWDTFGPGTFFGQEITHWMELPELPKEKE